MEERIKKKKTNEKKETKEIIWTDRQTDRQTERKEPKSWLSFYIEDFMFLSLNAFRPLRYRLIFLNDSAKIVSPNQYFSFMFIMIYLFVCMCFLLFNKSF